MEVLRRALDVDLDVEEPSQRQRDRRQVALEEAGVADDHRVRGEAAPIGFQPGMEVRRA